MYQAVIDVKSTIAPTESTVTKREVAKAEKKPVFEGRSLTMVLGPKTDK